MAKQKWSERWFHDIEKVLEKTRTYYEDAEKSWVRVTAKRVLDERKWIPQDNTNLLSQVEELQLTYIPSRVEPGPMFMFPEFDLEGKPRRAQTKPLYELLPNSKYVTLGCSKDEFFGPVWLGNQDRNLQLILEKRYVVVCEGPFDLLALRVANPLVPSMSSLTKKMGEDHVDYLRLLGVRKVFLMYDNESSEAGERSMKELQKIHEGTLDIVPLLCPAGDPSECLESLPRTKALRSILEDL